MLVKRGERMLTELSNNKFRKHQKTKKPYICPKICFNLQVTIIAQIKRNPGQLFGEICHKHDLAVDHGDRCRHRVFERTRPRMQERTLDLANNNYPT